MPIAPSSRIDSRTGCRAPGARRCGSGGFEDVDRVGVEESPSEYQATWLTIRAKATR